MNRGRKGVRILEGFEFSVPGDIAFDNSAAICNCHGALQKVTINKK